MKIAAARIRVSGVLRIVGHADHHGAGRGLTLFPVGEEQILGKRCGYEDQDDNHQDPDKPHTPHHRAVHHSIHHGRLPFMPRLALPLERRQDSNLCRRGALQKFKTLRDVTLSASLWSTPFLGAYRPSRHGRARDRKHRIGTLCGQPPLSPIRRGWRR